MNSIGPELVEGRNVFLVHVMVWTKQSAIHVKGSEADVRDVWKRKIHGVFYGRR